MRIDISFDTGSTLGQGSDRTEFSMYLASLFLYMFVQGRALLEAHSVLVL